MRFRFFLAAALLVSSASGQSYQTLPAGFDTLDGSSGTGFPFTLSFYTEHTWQWHYDSAQFNATGPVEITEIFVRSDGASGTGGIFDFPSLEVTLASSPTDYTVAGNGIQLGHDPVFANNLNSDATVVRSAAQWTGSGGYLDWIPFGLTSSFVYDPTQGDDFVVELRSCGINVMWAGALDGETGSTGLVGGNRYGDRFNCASTTQEFFNNEFVPIVRIEYQPVPTGPSLSIGGGAPGSTMTFDFAGFTPSSPIAVVYGPSGQYVVPAGPCALLPIDVLPLNFPPPTSLILLNSDGNGDAQLVQFVPPAGAGLLVQAADAATCTASNTVTL